MSDLLKALLENPDTIDTLTPEQIIDVRKQINPIGVITQASKKYANISITNWRDLYLRRLHTTALIGYMYRLVEEYNPDEHIKAMLAQMEAYAESCGEHEQFKSNISQHEELARRSLRVYAKQFLDYSFEYDPDRHVRAAHTTNDNDPERIKKEVSINHPDGHLTSLAKDDLYYKHVKDATLETYEAMRATKDAIRVTLESLDSADSADVRGILSKQLKVLTEKQETIQHIVDNFTSRDTLAAWKKNPPADFFYNYDRYLTNNFEALQDVCRAVYNEKPDIEFSIVFHDSYTSEDAARAYCNKHQDEFTSGVTTIENNCVCILGPYKQNRERLEYLNKNTEVLRRLMQQIEADQKFGRDLMEKQVKANKKKSIAEVGPDNPALADYSKSMSIVKDLGAKKALTPEEMRTLEEETQKATAIVEDLEVPDDAIQVDIFVPQLKDGKEVLVRKKFYTQAEAPLHLQENSEYAEKYQPKRDQA